MKTELERTKEALEVAKKAADDMAMCSKDLCSPLRNIYGEMVNTIGKILNPPPEYEEVTVTHWKGYNLAGDIIWDAQYRPETWNSDYPLVELTGTYKRIKDQPVLRSITWPLPEKGITSVTITLPDEATGAKGCIRAEWEE